MEERQREKLLGYVKALLNGIKNQSILDYLTVILRLGRFFSQILTIIRLHAIAIAKFPFRFDSIRFQFQNARNDTQNAPLNSIQPTLYIAIAIHI